MREEQTPPLVVFDCMLFLQGAARPQGPAAACLELVEQDRVQLCLSSEVIAEVRDVLLRPKLRHRFPILTPGYVDRFLAGLTAKAESFADVPRAVRYARDPKDEPYLNLALAAGARYLVSRDGDLLALAEPRDEETARIREQLPGLRIMDPPAFLRLLAGEP